MDRRSRRRRRRRSPKWADEEGGSPDLLSALPDELLGTILTFLPCTQAARTAILSSRWRRVWSISPLVLSPDDLSPPVSSNLLHLLSRHAGLAQSVHIAESSLPVPERSRCEGFRNKRIHHLHFEAVYPFSERFTDTLPEALISGGFLETLTMRSCLFHDPFAASQHLMHLKELRMIRCAWIDGDHFVAISALPVLLTLELSCKYAPTEFRISSKSLRMLALDSDGSAKVKSIDAPNLRELTVCGCNMSGKDIDAVVSNLPRLHQLRMRFLYVSSLSVHSMSLKRLVMCGPRIISTCRTCGPMKDLLLEAPNLKFLELDDIELSGSMFYRMLSNLPMLHTLNLRSVLFPVSMLHITSESLQHLQIDGERKFDEFSIAGAPNLRTILISGKSFERADFNSH